MFGCLVVFLLILLSLVLLATGAVFWAQAMILIAALVLAGWLAWRLFSPVIGG